MTEATFSKSAETVTNILTCLYHESRELGITEIAKQLDSYPSKIQRIANTLVRTGILKKNSVTKKYSIGLLLFEIGSLYHRDLNLLKIVKPHAIELSKTFTGNIHLGILSQSTPYTVLVIDRVMNYQTDGSIRRVSFNIPMHSSSMGKVLLAFSDVEKQEEILNNIEIKKLTPTTIANKKQLKKECKLIREKGYALDEGETHSNIYCIGVPLYSSEGLEGALSISGEKKINAEIKKEMIKTLIEKANSISYQMGSIF